MRPHGWIPTILAALALGVASAAAAQSNHAHVKDFTGVEPYSMTATPTAVPGAPIGMIPSNPD